MSTPKNIESLTATPLVVKETVGVLETLSLKNEHANGLWVHVFDRASASGIVVGTTPPATRFFFPSAPEEEDPPTTIVPMMKFHNGLVLVAVEEYSGGATAPSAGAIKGGAVIE